MGHPTHPVDPTATGPASPQELVRHLRGYEGGLPEAVRRPLLAAGATGAAAATLASPTVVKAQGPISMRFQSTWPSKDIFHEYALDYAKKVNDMTGGDLKIEVLPAGAVVPSQTKTISVRLDEERLRRLLDGGAAAD